jgi:hypothetical protein
MRGNATTLEARTAPVQWKSTLRPKICLKGDPRGPWGAKSTRRL